MKFYADTHHIKREFAVGDFVFLKLQPYRQTSVSLRKNLKLAVRYYVPCEILERIEKVGYCLDLPAGARVHPIFHVSLLKKVISPTITPLTNLPLDHRCITCKAIPISQSLVLLVISDLEAISWEDDVFMKGKFKNIHPCGQGSLEGRGIVVNWKVEEHGFEVMVGIDEEDGLLTEAMELSISGKRKESAGSAVGWEIYCFYQRLFITAIF